MVLSPEQGERILRKQTLNELWKSYHPDKWQFRDGVDERIKHGVAEVSKLLGALKHMQENGKDPTHAAVEWPPDTVLPQEIILPLPVHNTYVPFVAPFNNASPSVFLEAMQEFTKNPQQYYEMTRGAEKTPDFYSRLRVRRLKK